eukprot:1676439-Pyramimonas_sp.AAC.1
MQHWNPHISSSGGRRHSVELSSTRSASQAAAGQPAACWARPLRAQAEAARPTEGAGLDVGPNRRGWRIEGTYL